MYKIFFLIICVLNFAFSIQVQAKEKNSNLINIKIGWQIPWATQGQLVQILKHTHILEKHGLKAKFIGRTYGPLLNELALAGEIDVVLTADQPAIVLFSKEKGWKAIGRLMYNRTLTYAPPKSPIKNIADLKGKTIGIPIGAAAERITLEALAKHHLTPNKDFKVVNLGIREQGPLVLRGKNKKTWDVFDALSGFDPIPAIFQSKKLIKVLDVGKVVSVVLMNQKKINGKEQVAKKMMNALYDAYNYYRKNQKQANTWFIKEAGLKDITHEALRLAADIEPNLKVLHKKDIRVFLTQEDIKIMQKASNFLSKKIRKKVYVKKYIKNQFFRE